MKLKNLYEEILGDKSLTIKENLKKLTILLEREVKVGNNLSTKLKSIDSKLSNKILNFLNSNKIKDVNVDYVDYDPESEKLLTLGFKDNRGNDRVKKVKLLKLLSYLGAEINDIKGYEVEELINHLKKGDLDNFKLVKGGDILKAYHCENYDEDKTMGSCMRTKIAQKFLGIYTNNPNQVKCLVLFNPENNKVRGRALIWKLDDGTTYMDRVYVINKEYDKDFNTYAEKYGLSRGSTMGEITLENGGEYEHYPYMDTFMFYTPMDGLLSASHGEIELQDTNGGDSSGVWSNHYNENIPEDDAVYIEHMEDYFYFEDITPDWNGSEYLFIDSEDVVLITAGEYEGEYALIDDTMESYSGDIILNDYAHEIEYGQNEGEYAPEDELVQDYEDRLILKDYAIKLTNGEFEGKYAIDDEGIKDYVGDYILMDEAIECTIGSEKGEFVLKSEVFIFTSGRNKGFIFHESDVGEISNSGEHYIEYLQIGESQNKMKLTNLYEEILGGKQTINEINIPNLRLPNHAKVSDEEKKLVFNLKPNDLKINQIGNDGNIANMSIEVPWNSVINDNGIIVDIQVIKGGLYQVHIDINKNIRGLGLGYKIYVALINDLGHIYSSKGRRHNVGVIGKIINKLKTENDFESYNNNLGDLIILKNNPNKEDLLKLTNNL